MFIKNSTLHRYAALLILLLCACAISIMLNALFEMQVDAREQYDTSLMQLNKYQAITKQRPFYEAENKSLTTALATDNRFYESQTVSFAVAKFQKDLHTIIEQLGVSVISMQVVNAPDELEEFTPIHIKLRVDLNNTTLTQLLTLLEQRQPVGYINRLEVQYQPINNRSGFDSKESDVVLETLLEYTAFVVKPYDR